MTATATETTIKPKHNKSIITHKPITTKMRMNETEKLIFENISGAAYGSICAYILKYGSIYQINHINDIIKSKDKMARDIAPNWKLLRQRAYELCGDWLWMNAVNHFRTKIAPSMQIPNVLLDMILSVDMVKDGYGMFQILPPQEVMPTIMKVNNSGKKIVRKSHRHKKRNRNYDDEEDVSVATGTSSAGANVEELDAESISTTNSRRRQKHPVIKPKKVDTTIPPNVISSAPEYVGIHQRIQHNPTIFAALSSSQVPHSTQQLYGIFKTIQSPRYTWMPFLYYLLFLYPSSPVEYKNNPNCPKLLQKICIISCRILRSVLNSHKSSIHWGEYNSEEQRVIVALTSICKLSDIDEVATSHSCPSVLFLSSTYALVSLIQQINPPCPLLNYITSVLPQLRVNAEQCMNYRSSSDQLLKQVDSIVNIAKTWIYKYLKNEDDTNSTVIGLDDCKSVFGELDYKQFMEYIQKNA